MNELLIDFRIRPGKPSVAWAYTWDYGKQVHNRRKEYSAENFDALIALIRKDYPDFT